MRQAILWSAILGVLACAHIPRPSSEPFATVPRQEQPALNRQIVAALQSGRYRDAIQAARRGDASPAEIDFAVGEIILQGWADPGAVQSPVESLEASIALLERSALAGHRQAVSGLAAIFFTGLRKTASGPYLIAPDPHLNRCWETAKTVPEQAASCVSMRIGN